MNEETEIKPDMPEVMIDLETLGVNEDGMVVAIGLVAFDSANGIIGESLEILINPLVAEGEIDASTVMWWLQQDKDAQDANFQNNEEKMHTRQALHSVINFIYNNCRGDQTIVWANGPTFDVTKLERLFRKLNIRLPWKYNAARDMRTIRQIAGEFFPNMEPPTESVIKHSAVSDAIWQAEYVCLVFKEIFTAKRLATSYFEALIGSEPEEGSE